MSSASIDPLEHAPMLSVDLQAAIDRCLAETNQNPKPFIWAPDPDAIIEKALRGRPALRACGVPR